MLNLYLTERKLKCICFFSALTVRFFFSKRFLEWFFSLQDNLNGFLTFILFNLRVCVCVRVWRGQHDCNFLLKQLFIRYFDYFEALKLDKVQSIKNNYKRFFCYSDKYSLIVTKLDGWLRMKKKFLTLSKCLVLSLLFSFKS